ncbi:unnamed protein product [Paramecium pentaurelia]|uniref:non-specific serine/threonine protein kinase n=1 Tax=Paramecium pentaurelia TaxID=43138 RepID=A0A8S1WAU0_9CILI|nr:unnamed protein product [Paramecium pentaurelia]
MLSFQGFKQDKPLNEQIEELMDHLDYEHDSEDEGIEDYSIGGYHPVHIKGVLLNRYVVMQKGWFFYCMVGLRFSTYFCGFKIQKSASQYLEAAYDEVIVILGRNSIKNYLELYISQFGFNHLKNIMQMFRLSYVYQKQGRTSFNRDDTHKVYLLNFFLYKRPYGHHCCMVFEILGCFMDIVRSVAKQILIGLDYLHRILEVIHTYLKPENVLICLSDEEIKDIVENGQIQNHIYRQMLGIVEEITVVDDNNTVQKQEEDNLNTQSTNLTKTQKRKLLRKKNNNKNNQMNLLINILNIQNLKGLNQQKNCFNKKKISLAQQQKLLENFHQKIADLGNACWIHHHFSNLIQTRQYRSPEVLLGIKQNSIADIWSLACMIFEILTGEFLFEPRQSSNFSKNEVHLTQIQEILGKFPLEHYTRGFKAKQRSDKKVSITKLLEFIQYTTVNVLYNLWNKAIVQVFFYKNLINSNLFITYSVTDYYPFKLEEAQSFASFMIIQIFELSNVPEYRITAQEVLKRELCSNNLDDSHRLALLKKYIDSIFAFQNFRNIIPISGLLKAKTDQQIRYKMNEEEFKMYIKLKRENEEKEQSDQNIEGIQLSLLLKNRIV